MTTKMKGLLKGLRYISQIFDNGNYKEQEMQIGYPTDVKHVAHIGWDGPSVNPPSWMNAPEFSSAPLSMNRDAKEITVAKRTSEDLNRTGAGIQDFLARDTPELPKTSSRRQPLAGLPSSFDSPTRDPPKQSRRQQSNSVLINSPTRDLSDETKPRRRNKNSGISGLSIDSPTRDLSNETKLTGQNKNSIVNGLSIDSPTRDLSNETKPTRRNKNLGVNGISIDSPTRDLSNRTKSTRRSQNSGDGEVSINSPSRDLSDGSKPTRRNQNSSLGLDSLLQDSYAIPKQSRRRKSKGSSGGGSVRGSRLKEYVSSSYTSPFSDPGSGSGLINNELCSSSVLKAVEEEKGGTGHYGISRGIHDL